MYVNLHDESLVMKYILTVIFKVCVREVFLSFKNLES